MMFQEDFSYQFRRVIEQIRQNPVHLERFKKKVAQLREEREKNPDLPRPRGMSEQAFFEDNEDITVYLDFESDYFKHGPVDEARKRAQDNPDIGHTHEFFEMFYVYSGVVYCYVGGKEHILRKGTLWIMNTQARHGIILGDASTNLINILLRRSTFDTALISMVQDNDLFLNFFLNSMYSQDARPVHMKFHVDSGSRLEQHLYELVREYYENEPYNQCVMKYIFSCILVDLARQYRESLKDQTRKPDQMKLISGVIAYISDHFSTVTLQQVAEKFHYTTSYLSKYIQKHTGKSFSDLVTSFKMEKARQLLLNTTLSLNDIASAIGYSERSYFERMFKRYYSVTPYQYRKMHRDRTSA